MTASQAEQYHALLIKILTELVVFDPEQGYPSKRAMANAAQIAAQLVRSRMLPSRTVAMVEGGIAFYFFASDQKRYAFIECGNSGSVVAMQSVQDGKALSWSPDPAGVQKTLRRFRKHLGLAAEMVDA